MAPPIKKMAPRPAQCACPLEGCGHVATRRPDLIRHILAVHLRCSQFWCPRPGCNHRSQQKSNVWRHAYGCRGPGVSKLSRQQANQVRHDPIGRINNEPIFRQDARLKLLQDKWRRSLPLPELLADGSAVMGRWHHDGNGTITQRPITHRPTPATVVPPSPAVAEPAASLSLQLSPQRPAGSMESQVAGSSESRSAPSLVLPPPGPFASTSTNQAATPTSWDFDNFSHSIEPSMVPKHENFFDIPVPPNFEFKLNLAEIMPLSPPLPYFSSPLDGYLSSQASSPADSQPTFSPAPDLDDSFSIAQQPFTSLLPPAPQYGFPQPSTSVLPPAPQYGFPQPSTSVLPPAPQYGFPQPPGQWDYKFGSSINAVNDPFFEDWSQRFTL
ncbi:hypothetical protein BKA62DRAFT_766591 [Auriculariales sp. MPI-PUGE-AT-0066]|nr:hypothetical protein BKA62DRAFT_766591 [Auriculariales sp. MPI-PUGE-AT-0066]